MRLQDKVAVITGGGSGIGEASAKAYAREGAKVVIGDVNKEAGDRVVEEIKTSGGTAEFLHIDASKQEDLDRLIGHATDTFGSLDVLHNNHVWFESGRIGDLTIDGLRKSLDISLVSYWYSISLALKPMVAHGKGSIINTASVSGLAGDFGLGAYNMLKAGVVNLSRVTGIEYGRKGVRCNAICPGPIGTPPIEEQLKNALPQAYADIKQAIPMGRYGKPEEIANVAVFLASDESSFVNGTYIVADGGLHAHSGMPPIGGLGPDF